MKKFCSLTFFILLISTASGQWSQLKSPNIKGTARYDGLVYTGTAVVMSTDGGVFRSTDNGVTWALSVTGLDTTNLSVDNLAFIKSRSELWLVSNGKLFKSSNHGVSWNRVALSGNISPFGWPNRLGRVGNRLLIAYNDFDGTNLITRLGWSDDGATWNEGAIIAISETWIDFVKGFNDKLLVYMNNSESPRKFWYTIDGITVSQLPTTGLIGSPDIDTEFMSIDPEGNIIFFKDWVSKKLYYFNAKTGSWEVRMTGIEVPGAVLGELFGAHTLGKDAFASALFVKAFPPTQPDDLSLNLFHSSDTGKTWTAIANPGIEFPVFELMMVTAGSNRIIGSCFDHLMAYSDNAGQTWTKINEVYGGDYDYLIPLVDGSVLALSPDQLKGIVKSSDNGNTWSIHNGDLVNFLGINLIDAIWPGGPNVNYCTAYDDPFSEKLRLYKTLNGGVNWTRVTTAPDTDAKIFVGSHGTQNPIMFFGDREGNGTYQYTTDQGNTWVNLSPAINALGIQKVLGIKGNGLLMILFAEKNNKPRVYKSTDHGSSFTDITSNLDNSQLEILVADRWDWRRGPSGVAGFSADGMSFILAVIDWSQSPNEISFFILNGTQDGWTKAGSAGIRIPHYLEFHALRQVGGVWYFVTPVGVHASINNCATWQRVWNNQGFINGIRPRSFAATSNALFLGTEDAGLWRALISAPSITTNPATEINNESARSGASIVSTGGLPFAEKGLCWSISPSPTTGSNKLNAGNTWASFTATIPSLTPATKYYVRSFVDGPKGVVYGNEISFTTESWPLGISSGRAEDVQLYPNPSDGRFNVLSDTEMTMTVMNVIGKVVLSSPVYSGLNSFELYKQPAGIYFVKLTGTGKNSKTIRLIIR